ncbi:MAG: right-handed parallel beta-helix repeat-containing protein, partial [Ginsengibacter sp.]
PGLRTKESADIIVTKNQVHNNNHINFATPGEGFESLVPSGSGILVVGTDRTTVQDNHISGNNFVGVAVVSTVILGSVGGIPPEAFADIDPNADAAKIISNKLENNGSNSPNIGLPGVDLLWDGNGNGNSWSKNTFTSSYPSPLPACS